MLHDITIKLVKLITHDKVRFCSSLQSCENIDMVRFMVISFSQNKL